MTITLKNQHSLGELLNTGCKIEYSLEHCHFPLGELKTPAEVEVLPIPDDWDCDDLGWAPHGYEALHLSALIGVGIEHPELQKENGVKIIATGAVDNSSAVSFPTYPYLGVNEKGEPVIGIDGCGFVPFCLRNEAKYKFKLVGLFRKVQHDPSI